MAALGVCSVNSHGTLQMLPVALERISVLYHFSPFENKKSRMGQQGTWAKG